MIWLQLLTKPKSISSEDLKVGSGVVTTFSKPGCLSLKAKLFCQIQSRKATVLNRTVQNVYSKTLICLIRNKYLTCGFSKSTFSGL